MDVFADIKETIRRKKALFIILLLLTILMLVLGVFSAINFNGGIIPINLNNIPYINFLKEEISFVTLIFGLVLGTAIFYAVIVSTCFNPILSLLGIVFYLYFAYAQSVLFVSIILLYGFFNVLVLLILLLVLMLLEIILLLLILTNVSYYSGKEYFKQIFSCHNKILLVLSLTLLVLILLFCLILALLKNFVILLVF